MHAVIKNGGKQYRVEEGDVREIESLVAEPGQTLTFEDVVAVGDGADLQVGAPTVAGARVEVEVLEQTRGDKIIIFKKKRRQNYRRRTGHRQNLTVVRVTGIAAGAA